VLGRGAKTLFARINGDADRQRTRLLQYCRNLGSPPSADRGGIVSALSSAIKGASVAGRANGALDSDSLELAAMDADRPGSAVDAASLEPALMMPTKSQQFSGQI